MIALFFVPLVMMVFTFEISGLTKTYLVSLFFASSTVWEKRMGQEVAIDQLGDEFKGYVVRIGGGNDRQGFPMKQGE